MATNDCELPVEAGELVESSAAKFRICGDCGASVTEKVAEVNIGGVPGCSAFGFEARVFAHSASGTRRCGVLPLPLGVHRHPSHPRWLAFARYWTAVCL